MTESKQESVLAKLQTLQAHFEEIKIPAKVIEKNELLALDTLLVTAEGDYLGRNQFVNIAFLPDFSDGDGFLDLIQYFTELEKTVEKAQIPLVESLLNFINVRMPIGHFSVSNEKIYFRYVLAELSDHPDMSQKIIGTFFMYVDVLDLFQESIEDVLSGKSTLEAFMSKF